MEPKSPDFTTGRHLVWSACNEHTVCGLAIGLCVWNKLNRRRVHWSKARKTDCPVCRSEVRRDVMTRWYLAEHGGR